MPDAIHVRPGRWANITVLYDDGSYSAIWGDFSGKGQPTRSCLGVRWNGHPGHPGFPNQGKNSTWYVEPDFLTPAILKHLHNTVTALPPSPERTQRLSGIAAAVQAVS